MEFTMRVHMDSGEFEENPELALATILSTVSQEVLDGGTSDICIDRRGNTVGGWEINE